MRPETAKGAPLATSQGPCGQTKSWQVELAPGASGLIDLPTRSSAKSGREVSEMHRNSLTAKPLWSVYVCMTSAAFQNGPSDVVNTISACVGHIHQEAEIRT